MTGSRRFFAGVGKAVFWSCGGGARPNLEARGRASPQHRMEVLPLLAPSATLSYSHTLHPTPTQSARTQYISRASTHLSSHFSQLKSTKTSIAENHVAAVFSSCILKASHINFALLDNASEILSLLNCLGRSLRATCYTFDSSSDEKRWFSVPGLLE